MADSADHPPRRPEGAGMTGHIGSSWIDVLTTAVGVTSSATGPATLDRATDALRLAWATEGAVDGRTADDEIWWLRLAEAIADTIDRLEQVPAVGVVPLGTGPAPAAALTDTADLRRAVCALLIAAHRALHAYAAAARTAADGTAVAAAADRIARAIPTSGT
jgi:hypothetical protein